MAGIALFEEKLSEVPFGDLLQRFVAGRRKQSDCPGRRGLAWGCGDGFSPRGQEQFAIPALCELRQRGIAPRPSSRSFCSFRSCAGDSPRAAYPASLSRSSRAALRLISGYQAIVICSARRPCRDSGTPSSVFRSAEHPPRSVRRRRFWGQFLGLSYFRISLSVSIELCLFPGVPESRNNLSATESRAVWRPGSPLETQKYPAGSGSLRNLTYR